MIENNQLTVVVPECGALGQAVLDLRVYYVLHLRNPTWSRRCIQAMSSHKRLDLVSLLAHVNFCHLLCQALKKYTEICITTFTINVVIIISLE